MACEHSVVVKNTFISVLENDDDADATLLKTRVRTFSDPLPQQTSDHLSGHRLQNGLKEASLDAKMDALESPRTSVGCDYEASEGGSSSQQEWSSIDTPVHSPRPALLTCSSTSSSNGQDVLLIAPLCDASAHAKEKDIPIEWQGKTSVMVRNISYKCSRMMFCEALDKAGYKNLFNYVYVPINAGRGTSKGYAFANFLDDRTAYRFKEQFHGRKMDVPGSFKLLEIIPANLQGYSQNASHYIAKQSELSAASSSNPAQSLQVNADCNVDERSSYMRQRSKAPEEESTSSKCRHCQCQVLCRARFCQWCGVEL
eukprot:TRINITY_DN1887_c0_g3_i1.p1 TRINITY_DN1887_c0_g3~~TRINITY_DN1887_c0_g3_i1.p1  ORF type:complete len:313 (-),score=51.89 TRINITY_DN1887_c0_g3_i1:537-1475(-)